MSSFGYFYFLEPLYQLEKYCWLDDRISIYYYISVQKPYSKSNVKIKYAQQMHLEIHAIQVYHTKIDPDLKTICHIVTFDMCM